MKKVFLSLVLALATSFAVSAQGLTPYEWKPYKLSFLVPGGADILKSTNDEFIVDNDNYKVEIAVINIPLSEDDLSNFLIEKAKQEGMDISNGEVQTFSNTGVQGVSLEGPRDGGDQMCVAVLLDEQSETYILVSVIYADGLQDEANKIINSFKIK